MVSDKGNVMSLSFRNNQTTIRRELLMTPYDNGHGYLMVSLQKDGKRSPRYVHRLVAEAFVDNPEEKPVVNHIDHNTKNNSAENLEWCTVKENVRHSLHLMRKPRKKCKASNTGHKYISLRTKRGKPFYRVSVYGCSAERCFKTLKQAVEYKEEVMRGGNA